MTAAPAKSSAPAPSASRQELKDEIKKELLEELRFMLRDLKQQLLIELREELRTPGAASRPETGTERPPLPAVLPPLPKLRSSGKPDLGVNASLHGKRPFPPDNPWNQPIDREPVDPDSDRILAGIGGNLPLHPDFGSDYEGNPFGIPYVVVSGNTPKVPITIEYTSESDPGPYPIPLDAPIERGDAHVIAVDRDNWMLYELYDAAPTAGGFKAASGAIFDMNTNLLRPSGWTSADAAGLPIFPGLVRYDEVAEQKEIPHALRFTVKRTRRAYVFPARHFASGNTDPSLPPMGMRVRLKANYDISAFPPNVQVILKALKKYGMILADNGGNWFISGAPDPRWNDLEMAEIKRVTGKDLEVVKMGFLVTSSD